jgi:hypothetical protein
MSYETEFVSAVAFVLGSDGLMGMISTLLIIACVGAGFIAWGRINCVMNMHIFREYMRTYPGHCENGTKNCVGYRFIDHSPCDQCAADSQAW